MYQFLQQQKQLFRKCTVVQSKVRNDQTSTDKQHKNVLCSVVHRLNKQKKKKKSHAFVIAHSLTKQASTQTAS